MRVIKFILVTQRDGSVWRVPAELVANDKADYYADKEGEEVRVSEFEQMITSPGDLLDWASNNMWWADVKDYARQIHPPTPLSQHDMQEAWTNGEKECIWEEEVPEEPDSKQE